MRSIPEAMKAKLLNRFKASSTDSVPTIKLIATQTSVNTLLSEPILEDISPAFGDVTVRQTDGEASISLAYAICLDDGLATIYSRKFPANMDYKWEYVWTFGSASDVAIEYDGTWEMDTNQEWYYLRTQRYPYIFTVENGSLYVQYWNDASTRVFLADNVSQISACKGWKNSIEEELDQGLIIGYLRDGQVFYRALCTQEDGSIIWETERQVTELGNGNTTLSVIRTNDFRIGFITENAGALLLALTYRNYAGMSVRPETIHVNTKAKVWMPKVQRYYSENRETASGHMTYPYFLLDTVNSSSEITVTNVEKINREDIFYCYGFRLYLSHPLYGEIQSSFLNGCNISTNGITVNQAVYNSDLQAIELYTNEDISRAIKVTITTPMHRALWYYRFNNQKWFLPAFSLVCLAETIDHYTENVETLCVSCNAVIRYDKAMFITALSERNCVMVITTAGMTLEPASSLPI